MKLFLFMLSFVIFSLVNAQDSNHISQTYISIQPAFYSAFNGGSLQANSLKRTTFDIEIGKQWDAISLGVDLGKTSLEKTSRYYDSNTAPIGKWYLELKPNLNVFRQDKFTNTVTIGFGYVFNSNQNIMNEFSTGIEYDASTHWAYNIIYGTYYFTGNNMSTNQNYFGFSIVYLFTSKK